MRKLWLLFSQAVTLILALVLVLLTVAPDRLPSFKPDLGPVKPPAKVELPPPPPAQVSLSTVASFRSAAARATPSVVNIFTRTRLPRNPLLDDPVFRQFFGELPQSMQESSSLGSGVIVSADGHILTNQHVVASADQIEVALANGTMVPARLVGSDPETDLALIKADLSDAPAISFGESKSLQVGDFVLAIGNPFGVGQTVTLGIVSGLGRSHLGVATYENFIQTDAAINPGNSGGALVDGDGRLVGINSAIYSRSGGSQGIGFAIPVETARGVMQALMDHGHVTRGWAGVEVQDLTPELVSSLQLDASHGVLVTGVVRGGPADRGGVRPGDAVLAIAGEPVADASALLARVAGIAPDTKVAFTIARGPKTGEAEITIGTRPAQGGRTR